MLHWQSLLTSDNHRVMPCTTGLSRLNGGKKLTSDVLCRGWLLSRPNCSMVPAEARPAGMGRFLRPLLSSAEVVVSTSMMSSVMPALACKQDMDRATIAVDMFYCVCEQVYSVCEQVYYTCGQVYSACICNTLHPIPQEKGHVALGLQQVPFLVG